MDHTNIQWGDLFRRNIFIAHRSVGNNLIQGIRDYSQKIFKIEFKITNIDKETNFKKNGIFHSWVNGEGSPQAIAMDYINLVENKLKKKIDIAYIRFTPFYSDNNDKNLNKVLNDYMEAQLLLETKYPETIFIHGTFPLTHTKITLKTRIKKILKYGDIWEYGQNIYINKYNALIRETYGDKKSFFDFAEIESTYPNGQRSYFIHDGKKYYHLVSGYTYDGTHLNENGKIVVAERFIFLLSTLL